MLRESLQNADRALFKRLFYTTRHFDYRPIVWISKTGDGYLYLIIAAMLWLFDPTHGELFIYVGVLAYAMELPLFVLLKKWFKRPRPEDLFVNFRAHIKPSDKFSLPSGHTAAAFLMAVILAYFYPFISALAFTWAALIGLSRVLLGVHYPSDIVAGAALGSTIGVFSLVVLV